MMIKQMHDVANQTSLQLIKHYQQYLSPYKGFRCPAGCVYGDGTCSAVIKRIIEQKGLLAGLPDIHAQLARCKQAAKKLSRLSSGEQHATVFCCVLPIPL